MGLRLITATPGPLASRATTLFIVAIIALVLSLWALGELERLLMIPKRVLVFFHSVPDHLHTFTGEAGFSSMETVSNTPATPPKDASSSDPEPATP